MKPIDFTGKNAIVTGGARGIGKQIAVQLAQCGAKVWIADLIEENAIATAAELKAISGKSGYSIADVSDMKQVKNIFSEAKAGLGGKIDVVVHAAGMMVTGSLLDASQEQIERIIDVNMLGMCNALKASLEDMIPNRSGKIVLISSIAGRRGFRVQGHYNATKAAGINFAQSAAVEAGPYGINVNSVCPGIIRTDMWDRILKEAEERGVSQEDEWNSYMDMIPQGRAQTPEEIANAVIFLCSDLASAITGQALNVDGGMTLN